MQKSKTKNRPAAGLEAAERKRLERLFESSGFTDFHWLRGTEVVTGHWVRTKCLFGCSEYGKNASCPPNVPSVEECRKYFDEYRTAALLHFSVRVNKAEEVNLWTKTENRKLIALEREVFLAGYEKAFIFLVDSCNLCPRCAGTRSSCRFPKQSRPTVEAYAVDVYSTARNSGYSLAVRTSPEEEMNRYALLMVK